MDGHSQGHPHTPALFLDRDGVIVAESNGGAAQSPEALKLIPGICDVLALARRVGLRLVVISNQPDYALGKISLRQRNEIEGTFLKICEREGIVFDGVYYCYHHERASEPTLRVVCECKKPKPGLLLKAQKDLSINMAHSFFVGDRASDIRAGEDAGVTTILFDPLNKQTAYLEEHRVTPKVIVRSSRELLAFLMEKLA